MKIVGPARACVLLLVVIAMTDGAFASVAVSDAAVRSSWSVAPSVHSGTLSAVSCLGPNRCVAVGDFEGHRRTLSEAGNVNVWTVMPSPNVGTSSSLAGVSCVTATRCVAVGNAAARALIEIWNGDHWAIKPSPRVNGSDDLTSVSCLSMTFCVAVGPSDTNGTSRRLAEIWNGTRWSVMQNPALPLGWSGTLSGVSCAGPTRCVAVGTATPPGVVTQTLIEVWNGDHWAIKPSPTQGNANGRLLVAVSCASIASCVAVGWTGSGTGALRTVIESWNGTRWSITPSPNYKNATFSSTLSGVSCSSTNSCIAVGSAKLSEQSGAHARTLIERWDGTRWSLMPSPTSAGSQDYNDLSGVSCTTTHCEAVGYYYSTHFAAHTLALSETTPR